MSLHARIVRSTSIHSTPVNEQCAKCINNFKNLRITYMYLPKTETLLLIDHFVGFQPDVSNLEWDGEMVVPVAEYYRPIFPHTMPPPIPPECRVHLHTETANTYRFSPFSSGDPQCHAPPPHYTDTFIIRRRCCGFFGSTVRSGEMPPNARFTLLYTYLIQH